MQRRQVIIRQGDNFGEANQRRPRPHVARRWERRLHGEKQEARRSTEDDDGKRGRQGSELPARAQDEGRHNEQAVNRQITQYRGWHEGHRQLGVEMDADAKIVSIRDPVHSAIDDRIPGGDEQREEQSVAQLGTGGQIPEWLAA
jgi:hypothetical protein